MSESFLNRLLPNTGWGAKLTSIIPASRLGFGLGTLVVNIAVIGVCYFVGMQNLPLPLGLKATVLTGLAAQLALIRKREADIQPKRRWRFWYAAVFAILAFLWVDGATGKSSQDIIWGELGTLRTLSQVVLGVFLMFQILILPVTVSCCIRKAPLPP